MALLLCLLGMASGCADEPATVTPPGREAFDAIVYPILLQDCAFSGCHGDAQRFFQVYGPGRVRLDPATESFAGPTEQELSLAYHRSLSMLDPSGRPRASLLLTKPLDPGAGGAGHKGVDHWGQDVYTDANHPRFQLLQQWALSNAGVTP